MIFWFKSMRFLSMVLKLEGKIYCDKQQNILKKISPKRSKTLKKTFFRIDFIKKIKLTTKNLNFLLSPKMILLKSNKIVYMFIKLLIFLQIRYRSFKYAFYSNFKFQKKGKNSMHYAIKLRTITVHFEYLKSVYNFIQRKHL